MFIILEAIADQSLWIWRTFFDITVSNNHTNILQRSSLVRNFFSGEYDDISSDVNTRRYSKCYLVEDSIYPK